MQANKIRKGTRNMKYKKISHDQREMIITELTKNGKTLKEVSDETNLKPSTVKAILQVFLKEGRIGKKSTRDRKVKLLNTTVLALIDRNKISDQEMKTLSFIKPYVKVNQQSSEISHSGQTLAETQSKLETYSKQQVSQQIKDFLSEKKQEILDQLNSQSARNTFLGQLNQLQSSEIVPMKEMKIEAMNAEEDKLVNNIATYIKSKVKL